MLPFLPPAKSGRGGLLSVAILLLAGATILLLWSRIAPGYFQIGLAALLLAGAILAGIWLLRARAQSVESPRDWTLLHAALADGADATIVTDRNGELACVSPSFVAMFGGPVAPEHLPLPPADLARLAAAARMAMRDGQAEVDGLQFEDGAARAMLRRAGRREDHLVWRFRRIGPQNEYALVRDLLDGVGGKRLGAAGVMLALVDPDGTIVAANEVFTYRALGDAVADPVGVNMASSFRARPAADARVDILPTRGGARKCLAQARVRQREEMPALSTHFRRLETGRWC